MVTKDDVKVRQGLIEELLNLKTEWGIQEIDGVPLGKSKMRSSAEDGNHGCSMATLPISQVVSKLRSPDHEVVLQAVEALRARGNLSDGTLAWTCLQYANLQGANLSASNLKNADLNKADLEMADLSYANLDGTRLTRASMRSVNLEKTSMVGANLIGADLRDALVSQEGQLAAANRMRGSMMPDGNLYDGRFNLPGDYADACLLHIDLNDPAAIASFYGVTLEAFLFGQEWYRATMPNDSAWHKSACFRNAEVMITWM